MSHVPWKAHASQRKPVAEHLAGQYGTLLVAFILTFQALTVIEKAPDSQSERECTPGAMRFDGERGAFLELGIEGSQRSTECN